MSTKALVYDVADVEADLPSCRGVYIARSEAAHLTSEAVAVQYGCAQFGRNCPGERDILLFRRRVLQEVLTGLEGRGVIVRQDRPTFFAPKFADTPRPFGHATVRTGRIPDLRGGDHLADVRQEESTNKFLSAHRLSSLTNSVVGRT